MPRSGRWIAYGITALGLIAGCTGRPPLPRNFEECMRAGYPVMEIYPRRCAVPGGPTFTEPWAGPPQITPVPESPELIGEPTGVWAEGNVTIEALAVEPVGGNPTRVGLRLHGILGNPCTRLFPIRQEFSDHRLSLDIRAWQDAEMACIAVIEPLDLLVPLEQPLTAGEWIIEGGGIATTYAVPGFDD